MVMGIGFRSVDLDSFDDRAVGPLEGLCKRDMGTKRRSPCRQTTFTLADSTPADLVRFHGTVAATQRVVRPSKMLRPSYSDGFRWDAIALEGAQPAAGAPTPAACSTA